MRNLIQTVAVLIFACVLIQCSSNKVGMQYSAKEKAALIKFREIANEALYADYMKTNAYLIRWLRDQDFNLDRANRKLRKCSEWRKRNGVDALFQDPILQELNKTYPVQLIGHDRSGSPVATVSFGRWKVRKLVLNGLQTAVNRHFQSILELGLTRISEIQKEGGNVTHMILLADLAGFNVKEHTCLACLPIYPEIGITYENYYPDLIKTLITINTPKVFEHVMSLLTPVLAPKTRNIFKLFGVNKQEWQREILGRISPDELPKQFGGTRP